MKSSRNSIFFSGGGTLGSVIPLLGLYEDLRNKYSDYEYCWVGTKYGPEKDIVLKYDRIRYFGINSGKFRRYFSLKNVVDIFNVIIAFFQCLRLLKKNKPKLILTAGGFVCVPLCFAAKMLKIPFIVHQQDYEVGLANKLMAKSANVVTVVLDKSLKDYSKIKTNKLIKTGNLIRKSIFDFDINEAKRIFNIISSEKKILLVTGGGTGAEFINNLILKNLDKILEKYEVIHLVGKGKGLDIKSQGERIGYHVYETLSSEMSMALNLADVIISRAGFSTLTEICALKKPLILIPLPGHQDLNAGLFENKAFVHYQKELNENKFLEDLFKLADNDELRNIVGKEVGGVIETGNDAYMNLIEEYL